jgi:hypothetical protein
MVSNMASGKSILSILALVTLLANSGYATPHVNVSVSTLATHLESLQPQIFPGLQDISSEIFNHPEIGRDEFFAHEINIDYFQNVKPGLWEVSPFILPSLPTAWKLEFSHTPANWPRDQPLPTVGFLAEYDALEGIGHACGHNLIYLQGVYAANLARQALIDFDIPGRLVVIGTPDEEESCGKHDLYVAGVFEESQVWLMAHPTNANAIQPMSARQNIVVRVIQNSHFDAVKAAYNMLVPIKNLSGNLPVTSSTAALVADVGMFVCNVVQADISLGVVGPSLTTLNNTINAIKVANPGYATTNFTVADDPNMEGGVAIMFVGNAGHAAASNLGALDLSVDAFQALNASGPNFEFYLPDNTTSSELDFTVDVRTRFGDDLQEVVDFVLGFIPTTNFTLDVMYPALEVDPFLGPLFIDTIAQSEYGAEQWPLSTFAPAATDASWVQLPNVLAQGGNHTLQGVRKATLHANFNVCELEANLCPFNHEPPFRVISGTDFAYNQTEKVGRAIAQIAVQLLNDPDMMADATKNIQAGPHQV